MTTTTTIYQLELYSFDIGSYVPYEDLTYATLELAQQAVSYLEKGREGKDTSNLGDWATKDIFIRESTINTELDTDYLDTFLVEN